jgi:acylphosphatase
MQKIETVVSESSNGFSLKGTVMALDNGDVIVVVTGGRDHIGAVGLAVPRPSRLDSNNISATSSVLTMLGHKEDVLVKDISEKLAAATGRNIVVIAGVHYDDLSGIDLKLLHELWRELTDKIATFINQDH